MDSDLPPTVTVTLYVPEGTKTIPASSPRFWRRRLASGWKSQVVRLRPELAGPVRVAMVSPFASSILMEALPSCLSLTQYVILAPSAGLVAPKNRSPHIPSVKPRNRGREGADG